MSLFKNPAFWIILISFFVLIAAAITYVLTDDMTWYVWLILGLAVAGFIVGAILLAVQAFTDSDTIDDSDDDDETVDISIKQDSSLSATTVILDNKILPSPPLKTPNVELVSSRPPEDVRIGNQFTPSTPIPRDDILIRSQSRPSTPRLSNPRPSTQLPDETKSFSSKVMGNRIVTTETIITRTIEPCNTTCPSSSAVIPQSNGLLTSLSPSS